MNAHASKPNSIVLKKFKIKRIDVTFLAKWIVLVLVQRKTRPPKRLILTGPNNKNREMKHLQQFHNIFTTNHKWQVVIFGLKK